MDAVHDLNGLDAYTLRTVHEEDLVVAWHKRTSYTCYCLHAIQDINVIRAYIAVMLLASIS